MWELPQTLTLQINSQNVGTTILEKLSITRDGPNFFDFKQLKSKNQSYTLNLLKTFLSIRSLKN